MAINPGPDTRNMTMKEIFALRERRKEFTRQLENNELVFDVVTEIPAKKQCASCDAVPYRTESYEIENPDGSVYLVPAELIPVELIEIDSVLLCKKCFRAHWCVLPKHDGRSSHSSGHASIPASQRNYDGGNFHSGEW